MQPEIVPFICAKCGGAFSARDDGLCAVCHRPFCRWHLGLAHAVARAAHHEHEVRDAAGQPEDVEYLMEAEDLCPAARPPPGTARRALSG